MGSSSFAMVFYGITIDKCTGKLYDCNYYLTDSHYAGSQTDFEGNPVKPCGQDPCTCDHLEPDRDDFNDWKGEGGCRFLFYGYDNDHAIVVAESVKDDSIFHTITIDPLEMIPKPEWMDQLKRFAERRGLKFKEEDVSWRVGGSWYE